MSLPGLESALAVLRSGGIVAYPTETFYGVGGDARRADAARAVFALKGRAGSEPLPLVLPDAGWLEHVAVELTDLARRLAAAFWPGPLTVVVRAASWVPAEVHGGTGSVGVRVSPHPVAAALARGLGAPLVATSANRSGQPPARRADEVRAVFPDLVVVDGGQTPGGAPSTVVDATGRAPVLLRPGAIPWQQIARIS